MHFFRSALIGIVALSLAACTTTGAQQSYNEMDSALEAIGASEQKCMADAAQTAPEYEAIFEKKNGAFTNKAFQNKNYVQKNIKKSLQEVIDKMSACRDIKISQIQNHNNQYVRTFTYIAMEEKTLKNEVYQKYLSSKITAGQAVSSLQNISKMLSSKSDNHYQLLVSELNRQHFQQQQAQAAAWQAMGAAFQDYNRQQQQYYQQQQANRSVQTRCYWSAGVMNCTSY